MHEQGNNIPKQWPKNSNYKAGFVECQNMCKTAYKQFRIFLVGWTRSLQEVIFIVMNSAYFSAAQYELFNKYFISVPVDS